MNRQEIIKKYGEYFIEATPGTENTECYTVSSYMLDEDGEYAIPYLAIVELKPERRYRFCRTLKKNGHYNINLRRFDEEDFLDELAEIAEYQL